MFSRMVTDYWIPCGATGHAGEAGSHQLIVDETLPKERSLMLLEPVGRGGILSATSATMERLGLTRQSKIDSQALARALAAAHMKLHGADHLFYLPVEEQVAVQSEQVASMARQLHDTDAEAFAVLSGEAPEEEFDDAFVELDHWLVFGSFAGGRLACVASMYPWRDTHLADIGVFTLPAYRGRGLAKAVVRAMSAAVLGRGYEPQYRCQLDNSPSIALARSAGFERFGTWDAVDGSVD